MWSHLCQIWRTIPHVWGHFLRLFSFLSLRKNTKSSYFAITDQQKVLRDPPHKYILEYISSILLLHTKNLSFPSTFASPFCSPLESLFLFIKILSFKSGVDPHPSKAKCVDDPCPHQCRSCHLNKLPATINLRSSLPNSCEKWHLWAFLYKTTFFHALLSHIYANNGALSKLALNERISNQRLSFNQAHSK